MNNFIKLLFVGDIMPGGVLPYQDKYANDDVISYLHSFDFRIGTLECGVGSKDVWYKVNSICA